MCLNVKKPKVSVIIPVFNSEDFLEEAINSLLTQTLKEVELIFIDDGSQDRSYEILQEYRTYYSNIIVVRQENKGQSAARNKGITLSKGKYIYFFDSDDKLSDPKALEKCYIQAEKNNIDVVVFKAIDFDECFCLKTGLWKYKHVPQNICIDQVKFLNFIGYTALPLVWIYFIRSDVIKKNDIQFLEGVWHEDELFIAELIYKARNFYYISEYFYSRRIHSKSTTNNYVNKNKREQDKLVIISELGKLLYRSNNLAFNKYIQRTISNIVISLEHKKKPICTAEIIRSKIIYACRRLKNITNIF
ncbi:glycosyltransferase [Enterococcus faecium]|nr:glycosyltransferase [Enterococcus faecium]